MKACTFTGNAGEDEAGVHTAVEGEVGHAWAVGNCGHILHKKGLEELDNRLGDSMRAAIPMVEADTALRDSSKQAEEAAEEVAKTEGFHHPHQMHESEPCQKVRT
uniref:Uncharacterized protein n=1 Tax=Spongospora subterranea TaxID=70186 RepID=A0A0H5RLC0_9EUKA|eukprot:CRZ09519.1 hypothetical protein [Spongospora subterranea]